VPTRRQNRFGLKQRGIKSRTGRLKAPHNRLNFGRKGQRRLRPNVSGVEFRQSQFLLCLQRGGVLLPVRGLVDVWETNFVEVATLTDRGLLQATRLLSSLPLLLFKLGECVIVLRREDIQV
jgi:hypothetical protein